MVILSRRPIISLMAIVTACVAVGIFVLSKPMTAESGARWSNDTPPSLGFEYTPGIAYGSPEEPCNREKVFIGSDTAKSDMCTIDNGLWRYGWLYVPDGPAKPTYKQGVAVSFGDDSRMYRVYVLPGDIFMTNTNAAVVTLSDNTASPGEYGYRFPVLSVVHDLPAKITKDVVGGETQYSFINMRDGILKWQDGEPIHVNAIATSSNRKWLVAELPEKGIMLMNLETFEAKKISSLSRSYSHGTNPQVQLTVSDDGRYIAAMGWNFPATIITTDGCGDDVVQEANGDIPLEKPCEEFSLNEYLSSRISEFRFGQYPYFNNDATELRFFIGASGNISTWAVLGAPKHNDTTQIGYLALGDSYSSGEGDTETNPNTGAKYYLPLTDMEGSSTTPREMCHISSRSYPFQLMSAMRIPADRMESIACSGAVGHTDYVQSNEGYEGQDGRLGVLKDAGTIEQYKTTALNKFIPGRDQQIEFVKKYQPKAITLTAGGNDVDFGGVAMACAPPNVVTSHSSSCDYASTDKGKARLGSAISQQYKNLTKLYKQLHDASPNTKIYVIGYPQFFSADKAICALNVRFDKDERIMARAAVSYLNDVIEAAAKTAGVKYVDIENSLGDHVLCGNEKPYVTGLAGSGKRTVNIAELVSPESFHPNADGHRAIAAAIQADLKEQTLTDYNYCSDHTKTLCPDASVTAPQPVSYFAGAMNHDITNYTHVSMTQKILQKDKDTLKVALNDLQPLSAATVKIFSDPTDLGTYTVDSEGRLNTSIFIPADLPAGFHTLEVAGATFSGEPITFWQIVEIHGPTGDIDENGVPDSEQQCLLVPASGSDYDGDGIDDGCDPEIGPASVTIPNAGSDSGSQTWGEGSSGDAPVAKSYTVQTSKASLSIAPVSQLFRLFGSSTETSGWSNTDTVSLQDTSDSAAAYSQSPSVSEHSARATSDGGSTMLSLVELSGLTGGVVVLITSLWLARRVGNRRKD